MSTATWRLAGRALLSVLGLAAVGLGTTLGWLKLHESELVFHTAESRHHTDGQLPAGAQRLSLRLGDGEVIAAVVLAAAPDHDAGYWVLHLHGNADSAFSSTHLRHMERLRALGLNVLGLDYRGFGLSEGSASETHVDEDAQAGYQELIRRGVPPQKIIVWGHSLGSGPAVWLASTRPVAALVLFGAFTSIPDAAEDTYPHLPAVRWLASVQFDSIHRITAVHAPVLVAHAVADTIIPIHHGRELFAAAPEPKRLLELSPPYGDSFGGHITALYDHLDLAAAALNALTGIALPSDTAP